MTNLACTQQMYLLKESCTFERIFVKFSKSEIVLLVPLAHIASYSFRQLLLLCQNLSTHSSLYVGISLSNCLTFWEEQVTSVLPFFLLHKIEVINNWFHLKVIFLLRVGNFQHSNSDRLGPHFLHRARGSVQVNHIMVNRVEKSCLFFRLYKPDHFLK